MQSKKNLIVSAVAGSGKTTRIINDCYSNRNKKILFTTFINNNADVIRAKLTEKFGIVPPNIIVQSWYSFLIDNWVKPYANITMKFEIERINGMIKSNNISGRYQSRGTKLHYFTENFEIYSDKVAEFGSASNENTSGKNIKRLEEMYNRIYIDEVQDLSGYDMNILDFLMKSKLEMVVVGDSMQNIYDTNPSPWRTKDSEDVLKYLRDTYLHISEYESIYRTRRCNKGICKFINGLYPEMEFEPLDEDSEMLEPQIIRGPDALKEYVGRMQPLILGYNINANPGFGEYMNIGKSKGLEADHVVIVTTKAYREYLTKGKNIDKTSTKRILYVAVTRAKYTIAFYIE